MNLSPFEGNQNRFLEEELFPKEGDNLRYLADNRQPEHPAEGYPTPRPIFYGNKTLPHMDNDYCVFTNFSHSHNEIGNDSSTSSTEVLKSRLNEGQHLLGRDLARSVAQVVYSPTQCCEACRVQELCVGWNYESEETEETEESEEEAKNAKHICVLKATVTSLSNDSNIGTINSTVSWKPETLPTKISSGMCIEIYVLQYITHIYVYGYIRIYIGAMKARLPRPTAVILHGTMCIHRNNSIARTKRDINTIYIGRYMMERASFAGGLNLDEYSVAMCASAVDEVWVPTEWHREVFVKFMQIMGMPAPQGMILTCSIPHTHTTYSYHIPHTTYSHLFSLLQDHHEEESKERHYRSRVDSKYTGIASRIRKLY